LAIHINMQIRRYRDGCKARIPWEEDDEVLESEQSGPTLSATIDPNLRRQLVATEAYFLAERRGFTAGHELEDWAAAEAAVDLRCHKMRVA
jgi:hypothetical protein